MNTHVLHGNAYSLQLIETGCRLQLLDRQRQIKYETKAVAGDAQNVKKGESSLSFTLELSAQAIGVSIQWMEDGSLSVILSGDGMMTPCAFPGPWVPVAEDRLLYPIGDGIMLPVDSLPPIPQRLLYYSGSSLSMGMIGFLRGNGGLMMGIAETADAELHWHTNTEGYTENQVVFIPSKGKWRYPREIRIFVAENDGFNALCHAYRAWRMEMGMVVPLLKKAEHAPRILGMAGRADLWLWDDQNMNRLYGRPVELEKTPRDVKRVAEELLERGMTRILWNSFEGENREDADYLKEMGFEVGRYDIYRDVIPKPNIPFMLPYRVKRSRHTDTCWPQDVRRNEKGEYDTCWQLHGTDGKMHDQHAICDIPALRMTMEDVPKFVDETGYTSWFIDVGTGAIRRECYDPRHPADRRDSMRYLNAQNQFLLDMGLINGVEVGCEAGASTYVFSEGMMSPPCFRAPDAGRRMNTLYYGDEVPEKIPECMLNPRIRIPLWQMIYHDCTINYWYWGDSSNCCPEWMPRRDQFNALYAVPPLYSLNMTQWDEMKDEIAASYHRAVVGAKAAAFSPMIRFDILTDDQLVQKTTFENGVTVTVNFSENSYQDIPAGGCRVKDEMDRVIAAF